MYTHTHTQTHTHRSMEGYTHRLTRTIVAVCKNAAVTYITKSNRPESVFRGDMGGVGQKYILVFYETHQQAYQVCNWSVYGLKN